VAEVNDGSVSRVHARAIRSTAVVASRRAVLTGAAAAVIGIAAARQRVLASSSHVVRIGDASVTVLSDGVFSLPADLALGGRSADDIAALARDAGAGVTFEMQTNVAVVSLGAARVLVDCGAGPDLFPSLGKLPERLAASGIEPASITHVVFTHAHADHLWGALDEFGEGLRFDKARHLMAAAELDYWRSVDAGALPERIRGMAAGTQRRLKLVGDRIAPTKAGSEILPGLALIDTGGHTPGHVSVRVESKGQILVIGGDALVHAIVSVSRPDWRWGSDFDPDRAIATRKRLLGLLASEKALLLGYHLPWPGVGRIEPAGTSHRWVAA
jgi:glyoxylase-like metal-dependent hydrolase (beta-lactamase superfamily II)